MDLAKSLQALKVPELKAKCKELKIPNFSKLSKADLIAKILDASKGTTTGSGPTHSNLTFNESAHSTSTSTKLPDAGNVTAKAKEGKVTKKRKATDQPGPPTSKAGESRAPDAHLAQVQEQVLPVRASVENPITNQAGSSVPSSSSQLAQIPPKPQKVNAIKKNLVASSTTNIPKPVSYSTPQVSPSPSKIVARPQAISKQPASLKTQANTIPSTKTKSKAVKIPIKNTIKPEFRPLIQSKSVQTRPIPSQTQEQVIDLSTLSARIKFIETHFLNTLFTYLHQYRAKAITGPSFPCSPSFTQSKTYFQTSHLAFQGFHTDVYNSDPDAFQVAIRFWIARMHSYMQLGSGEAWSGNAGSTGILGPDMATWPPVVGVKKVTEEVWAVVTEEKEVEISYLVIGESGEVVANSKGVTGDEELVNGCVVRGDWARYLAAPSQKTLISMVRSKESYDFPGGVAKAWARKQPEGTIRIANRAVLASCALNSFSGDKLSALDMDGHSIGRPGLGSLINKDLEFYLPENSQILSVHRPADLHLELAIVQRGSGFSEFVLAQTGQMVGLEDEGVVSLWQGLLGCNAKGQADDSGHREFWKGWGSRMKFI